jgi:tetratricopeptide (TPR) repeat protein
VASPSNGANRGRPKSDRGRAFGTQRGSKTAQPHETERERRARKRSEDSELPSGVREELRNAIGPDRSAALERRLAVATRAYERDRYREALAELRVLARLAPEVASVRELYGLTLYRLGRWREAARELKAFHELSGSFDQHPVIADCERALGRDKQVAELWNAMRTAGVDREVLIEGRLVMAGMLADRGEISEAIALLAPGAKNIRKPDTCHLRQWYALGDCYERAGDLPRARELFARVASFDEELSDAPQRLDALR